MSKVLLGVLGLVISNFAMAVDVDYQCSPFAGSKPEILSISTYTTSESATVDVFTVDKEGNKFQKSLDAERSIDMDVIYFTTDESILVIDPNDIDPASGGLKGMYMIPNKEQIPMICQSLI